MEERFKMWLRVCLTRNDMSQEELKRLVNRDKEFCQLIFNEFRDFDSCVISDFVQDCSVDIAKEQANGK